MAQKAKIRPIWSPWRVPGCVGVFDEPLEGLFRKATVQFVQKAALNFFPEKEIIYTLLPNEKRPCHSLHVEGAAGQLG
jgi:hypothetical protein